MLLNGCLHIWREKKTFMKKSNSTLDKRLWTAKNIATKDAGSCFSTLAMAMSKGLGDTVAREDRSRKTRFTLSLHFLPFMNN